MLEKFEDIPEEERTFLKTRYLDDWKSKISTKESEVARESIRDNFDYLLRMFWQARFDKLDQDSIKLFDWLSSNMLPENVKYDGIKHHQNLIEPTNHKQLANQLLDQIWELYANSPESGLAIEETPSFTNRILSIFRR